MATVGQELFNGAVIVVSVDPDGLITSVKIPLLGAPGVPFIITFTPAKTVEDVIAILSGEWPDL